MIKEKKQKIIVFALLLMLLLGANFVYALEINYPRFPGTIPPQDFGSAPPEELLSYYVKYIFDVAIWAGGILALAGLIYGGILYLISTGKPDRMISAKNQISAAFFGLLILLSSYLILNTISPQFTELKLEPLEPIEIEKQREIKSPIAEISTSIDPESSPGRIIEKIFETYISEYPEPAQKWTPRIMRLKNNTNATEEIVARLVNQSRTLRDAADDCKCDNTLPDPRCNSCSHCPPKECTCDPCSKNVRNTIQSNEQKNLNEIYIGKGTTVSNQMNVDWQLETIPSTLIKEMLKTEDEVRLLKEQLDRLKRAEKYIKECPLRSLRSYVQLLDLKKSLENEEGMVRRIDFWNDVNIIYYMPKEEPPRYKPEPYEEKEYVFDFATFYCDVSGTLEQAFYPVLSPSAGATGLSGYESEEEAEKVLSKTMACGTEAAFGEFSDRVKRITQLLIDKFEEIAKLDKKLIEETDELQRAISECTSKRCTPICSKHHILGVCFCIEWGCFSILFDKPCPMDKIDDIFDDIRKIQDEIGFLIDGRGGAVTPENIGIITLIDEYVPQILEELAKLIRRPMKECFFETLEKKGTVLFNCSQSKGATTPEGEIILYCSQTEKTQNGVEQRTSFGDCFEKCYLEKNQEKHRECVNLCLARKASELNDDRLAKSIHELNFYCCNAGEY